MRSSWPELLPFILSEIVGPNASSTVPLNGQNTKADSVGCYDHRDLFAKAGCHGKVNLVFRQRDKDSQVRQGWILTFGKHVLDVPWQLALRSFPSECKSHC